MSSAPSPRSSKTMVPIEKSLEASVTANLSGTNMGVEPSPALSNLAIAKVESKELVFAKNSSEVDQSSSEQAVGELDGNANFQTKVSLKAIPFQPGYEGTHAVVTVTDVGNICVAFDKSTNGEFVGEISLTNLLGGPVVYKVATTDKNMFECNPSLGIIQGNGEVTITVTTGVKKVKWGDVSRQLFFVQSVPVEVETICNDKPKIAPITVEAMDDALKLFWSEEEEIRKDTDMLLLIPKANSSSFALEPSHHELQVQSYFCSRLVRCNRYFRFWWKPYVLDHPSFKMNFPYAYKYLEDRVFKESPFWSFVNRSQLVYSDHVRLSALRNAKWTGGINIFVVKSFFVAVCIGVFIFWTMKTGHDEVLAYRDLPWYSKLFQWIF